MKRRFASIVCVVAWVLAIPWPAGSQSSTRAIAVPREVTIRFEGGLASANFAEVIATLGATERLPLVAYVDRDGSTPAEVLAKTGRLVGATVPPALDAYLCSINRHVCDPRRSARRGRWKNDKAPADAAQVDKTCFDEGLPPYVLCLPDIKVHSYLTTAIYSFDAKQEKLETLVVDRTGGCTKLDDRCERLIKDLNRMPSLSDQFAGKLRLPVRGYRVTVPVADLRQLENITTTLEQVIGKLRAAGGLANQQMNLYYTIPSPALKAQSHRPKLADIETEPLATYLRPLQVMSYPYRSATEFNNEKLEQVMVGVWDRRVDAEHCDYVALDGKAAIALSDPLERDPEKDPPIPAKAAGCEQVRAPLEQRWDHGTGVAGIIGARYNGHGIAGVNPKAYLWTYEMDAGARLEKDDDPLFRLVSSTPLKSPMVINISLAEPMAQYQSPLEPFIKKNPHILWVTAAGNQGAQANDIGECRIVPACLSALRPYGDSVISVVALDDTGTGRWIADSRNSSNWGTAFDVAAVGVTVSTLHGNAFGSIVGTSAAAPYVTGLASLIFARSRVTVKPRDVKERILFTADFSETFDSIVRFGRINFARALRFEDRIELKKDFCTAAGCQVARPIKRVGEDPIIVSEGVLNGQERTDIPLRVSAIRRIAAKDDGDRFWIVYAEVDGTLQKIQDAKFKGTPQLKFKDGIQPAAVQITTIKDYTCALPCN